MHPIGIEEAMVPAKVLLVDDDLRTVREIKSTLTYEGYEVDCSLPGSATIRHVLGFNPDLVVLGVGAGRGTWSLCRQLLANLDHPLLLLLDSCDPLERAKGLELGADDCLAKPVVAAELAARVGALMRRTDRDHRRGLFVDGDLMVDLHRREIRIDDQPVALTPTEFRLLSCLVRHAGELRSHQQLLTEVWGPGYLGSANLVKQHIHHLRRKLETDPVHPRHILTRWGEGYVLRSMPAAEATIQMSC